MRPAAKTIGILIAVLAVALAFWPAVDLFVTGLFYSPKDWFFWRYAAPLEFVRKALPTLILGLAGYLALIGFANILLKDRLLGVTPRVMLYLGSTLALGPGLIVNALFKDHWGRARPTQIVEFGGKARFSGPFVLSDQCADNCSFASGHAAVAFWTVALALILPPPWRPRAVMAALIFGLATGLVRVIQGAHFYSDVVMAGLITVGLAVLLRRPILGTQSLQFEGEAGTPGSEK
ncbi:MAG: phosphatase PAP2 family protein [Rhodospirillales bacterium]|nr:phosphatase PAP2 family protein [Rhodospirillales bacterium]